MNVIWMVADTVRTDAVGIYGNKVMRTPALDAFAEKSIRFNRHYIGSFPTMPARADFMTGKWTMSFMHWEPLPRDEVTLAELIAKKDINTTAIVDTPFFLRDGMGYDRGFSTFNEIPGHYYVAKGGGRHRMDAVDVRPTFRLEADCFAPQTFARTMQWMELHYKDDFFLFIDTWDPHEPWNPPNYYTEMYWPNFDGDIPGPLYGYIKDRPGLTEEKVKKAEAAYHGEMSMVDTWVGNLLRQAENMGLMENTAIIFTTDHGYYFGEHGGLYGKMVFARDPDPEHGRAGSWDRSPLHNEVALIPLIIYVPGLKPGIYDGLTSAVDLMPTVLDLMGVDIPLRVEGRSLFPAMKDLKTPGHDYIISALPFINAGDSDLSVDHINRNSINTSLATITTDEWSLIFDCEPGGSELYNLKTDPEEKNNIIDQNPDTARELHKYLLEFMQKTNVSQRLQEPRMELRM